MKKLLAAVMMVSVPSITIGASLDDIARKQDPRFVKKIGPILDILSKPSAVLVHPDGRYIYNVNKDIGGGMAILYRTTYRDESGRVLLQADVEQEDPDLGNFGGQVEGAIRAAYFTEGYHPLIRKEKVEELSGVVLLDPKGGYGLKVTWRDKKYFVRLGKPVSAGEIDSCPSGKVLAHRETAKGVVIWFQPPDTYVDAEGGPSRSCSKTMAAGRLVLSGRWPIFEFEGRSLKMK